MSNNTVLPNFLIVGAAKCGTTSLYHGLRQHPEIYLPEELKELFFFIQPKSLLGKPVEGLNIKTVDDYKEYCGLYKNIKNTNKAIGEITPIYLMYYKEAIPLIKKYLGNPKIIIILRNPVERAYSNYLHHVRDNYESLTFENALRQEDIRRNENCWYSFRLKEGSKYFNAVEEYLGHFSDVDIKLYDDLLKDSNTFYKSLFSFLDVDMNFYPMLKEKYNKTGEPRFKALQYFLQNNNKFKDIIKIKILKYFPNFHKLIQEKSKLIQKTNIYKPKIKPLLYNELIEHFKEDITKTAELSGLDLSTWLEKRT